MSDKYQKELDKKKKSLQECQKEKDLNSCMKCDKIFECQTRKEYVEAVYESMSQGVAGGFEF
jgi:hypothetical protein